MNISSEQRTTDDTEMFENDAGSPDARDRNGVGNHLDMALMSPAPISLGQIDTRTLLDRMGALRQEAERVQRHLHAGSIPHRRLACLVEDIDENAMLLTGDRRHFRSHARTS